MYCLFTLFTFHEPTFYVVTLFLFTNPALQELRRTEAGHSTELCCLLSNPEWTPDQAVTYIKHLRVFPPLCVLPLSGEEVQTC
jgi:hypothetical protein